MSYGDPNLDKMAEALEQLPLHAVEALLTGLTQEKVICAGAYTAREHKPVGCLFAAAAWHTSKFQQSLEGLTPEQRNSRQLQLDDVWYITEALDLDDGDDHLVNEAINAFDGYAANNEINEGGAFGKSLGPARTRTSTYKIKRYDGTDYDASFKALTPQGKREVMAVVTSIRDRLREGSMQA